MDNFQFDTEKLAIKSGWACSGICNTIRIPAYFVLNYTRVELVALQEKYKATGMGKNMPVVMLYLHKSLLSIDSAQEWLCVHEISPMPNINASELAKLKDAPKFKDLIK
ncbi:MAG: hypothetical protein LBL13_08455 [Bacteroidales bacterium]|jgi:hypothetical protein|nr:hypothetical protein [Bacteroidales bacterium]